MHSLKLYRITGVGDISYVAGDPNYFFPINMPDGTVALFPLREAIIAEMDRVVEAIYPPAAPAESTDGEPTEGEQAEETGEDNPQEEGEKPEG